MFKYKLTIEYDGSKYKGWQRLKDSDKTIQEKVETLLTRIIGSPIEIHGSGRTDAGTHAYHQVAHFETKSELDMDFEKFVFVCNEMLPQDIVFKNIEAVDSDFHARFSVKSKQYIYKVWNSNIRSALYAKYMYQVDEPLNISEIKKAAAYLIGEHNFRSFTADKSKKKTMVRSLSRIEIVKEKEVVEFHFYGEGFLYKMVRIMVGTLLEVGKGIRKPEEMIDILNRQERKYAGDTAPSHGLYLANIEY